MSGDSRENVFTQAVSAINKFSEHEINKEQLYDIFVHLMEICDEDEKKERERYLDLCQDIEDRGRIPLPSLEPTLKPYSNWWEGKKLLDNAWNK